MQVKSPLPLSPNAVDLPSEYGNLSQVLLAVEPVKQPGTRSKGQARWWTAYELNRAIRRHEGTSQDESAELDFWRWSDPLSEWLGRHSEWAEWQGIHTEDFFNTMEDHWGDSCGAHRDPFQAAIDEFNDKPEAVTIDQLKRKTPLTRKAATFCLALAKARKDGGRFFLSQADLGEVINCSGPGARSTLHILVGLDLLECTRKGYRGGGESVASEWVLKGELLQLSSSPDLQDPSRAPIPAPVERASMDSHSPVPEPEAETDHGEGIGASRLEDDFDQETKTGIDSPKSPKTDAYRQHSVRASLGSRVERQAEPEPPQFTDHTQPESGRSQGNHDRNPEPHRPRGAETRPVAAFSLDSTAQGSLAARCKSLSFTIFS